MSFLRSPSIFLKLNIKALRRVVKNRSLVRQLDLFKKKLEPFDSINEECPFERNLDNKFMPKDIEDFGLGRKCMQINVGMDYISLNPADIAELKDILKSYKVK